MDRYRSQVINYMQQQVLLSLNRVNPNKPPLRKPQPPELPQRIQMGPHLPNALMDIEPLHQIHTPKLRRRQRAIWAPNQPRPQPTAISKPPPFKPPPFKPLPPIKPPPPQPQLIQNRPDTKGRNSKKAAFKVSFIEPQVQQQPERQQEEVQHHKVDTRWNTINQPTRKWVRKKGSTAASNKTVDKSRSSTNRSIDVRLSSIDVDLSFAEPPAEPPPEPLHQSSIQKISKKAERRQRIEHVEDSA